MLVRKRGLCGFPLGTYVAIFAIYMLLHISGFYSVSHIGHTFIRNLGIFISVSPAHLDICSSYPLGQGRVRRNFIRQEGNPLSIFLGTVLLVVLIRVSSPSQTTGGATVAPSFRPPTYFGRDCTGWVQRLLLCHVASLECRHSRGVPASYCSCVFSVCAVYTLPCWLAVPVFLKC